MVVPIPVNYGFTAEYPNFPDHEGFSGYLRSEFGQRHPDWRARFGIASWFDPTLNGYDYLYLLHGNVPEAKSQADAEKRVHELLDELERGLKSGKTRIRLPKPRIRIWQG